MMDPTYEAQRRALNEIISRRTLFGVSLLGIAGMLSLSHVSDAKKKKKHKKRCKNGAKRCGTGCCKAPSVCSAGSCFCTGNEGNCTSIPAALIALIAEALGVPPEQIGANPDKPLAQCPTIPAPKKDEIDITIAKEFGVGGAVPWCEGGIAASVDDLREQLTIKA